MDPMSRATTQNIGTKLSLGIKKNMPELGRYVSENGVLQQKSRFLTLDVAMYGIDLWQM